MPAARESAPSAPSPPPRDTAPIGAPAAFGPDVAWISEMKARHVALERAAEESVKAAERRVLDAHYELEAQRRMYVLAAKTTEPLSAQAVEERIKLYESGRGDFAELVASMRRHLDAAHDAVAARHDYFMAQAMLWMAVGARPELVRDAGEGEKR
jgi:outer membrane protein TolC